MADVNEPEVSKSGIYFDSIAGKVVDGRPVEGVQLVPPGGVVDADAKADIARYKGDAPPVVAVGAPEPEPEVAEPKKAPAAKKAR